MKELILSGATVSLAACHHPGPGPSVIALHGWMDNAGTFEPLASLLPDLDLVALDLPGHGRSQHRPPEAFYHFIDWVPEVLAAADSLGWERFGLLGHSMGAGIATLVAGTAPERLERMVLLEGLGPMTSPESESVALLRRSLSFQLQKEAPTYPSFEATVERLEKRGLTRAGAEALAKRAVVKCERGFRFGHDPRLRVPSRTRLTEPQVLAFIRAIEADTLLILAEDGLKFPEPQVRSRLQALTGGQVTQAPGGHHFHLDQPAGVAPLVSQWLNRCDEDEEEGACGSG